MKKLLVALIFIVAVFTLMFLYTAQQQSLDQASWEELPQIPAPGQVTMVNMGSASCLPCRMMQPFLEELKVEYENKAKIAFIDVWKHTEYGQIFEITTIPTQIFFDHQGIEIFRHQGFLDKTSIVNIVEELLEKQEAGAQSPAGPTEP